MRCGWLKNELEIEGKKGQSLLRVGTMFHEPKRVDVC